MLLEASREENPLREGMERERTPEPCVMVIFGASGDLTSRKLLPAIYNLAREHYLPGGFSLVGFARTPMTNEQFRQEMFDAVQEFSRNKPVSQPVWDSFSQGIFYQAADYGDPAAYEKLGELLGQIDRERGTMGNRVFYLATPPGVYSTIVQQLGSSGLAKPASGDSWVRIIIEKPFGRDLESAHALNQLVGQVFAEDQIYRIDHYLGKETVQNILVFRFANGIFEPIWNRRYIDHVQITVSETIGMEGRGGYYDESGTIRDMVQNHMMQILALICMEPPIAMGANAVRDEKVKVLHAIRPIQPDQVLEFTVRGQYGPGVIGGKQVTGYRQEKGVKPNSLTETYVAIKLFVDNWRWAGVPIYLRSGKRLPKRVSEVAIQFKQAPLLLFKNSRMTGLDPNILTLRLQPDEGISLKFGAKIPGQTIQILPVNMDFRYGSSFGVEPPDAYERLLLDCMLGEATLFTRSDEVEVAWAFVTRILQGWQQHPPEAFPNYPAGTWGPERANQFIEAEGRTWRRP